MPNCVTRLDIQTYGITTSFSCALPFTCLHLTEVHVITFSLRTYLLFCTLPFLLLFFSLEHFFFLPALKQAIFLDHNNLFNHFKWPAKLMLMSFIMLSAPWTPQLRIIFRQLFFYYAMLVLSCLSNFHLNFFPTNSVNQQTTGSLKNPRKSTMETMGTLFINSSEDVPLLKEN